MARLLPLFDNPMAAAAAWVGSWVPALRPTGLLRDFDVTDRLGEIQVPALVVSGVADEVTPLQSKLLADRLPDAEWVLFQQSAHSAILEEPELHASVLHDFLDQVEARQQSDSPRA